MSLVKKKDRSSRFCVEYRQLNKLMIKNKYPLGLDDYSLISLVGCIYKIISKILANKVKSVLPKIIDSFQSTFLKGRGFLGNILVANEAVEECKLRRKRMLIVKVDYENTYNLVSLDFLYYMMGKLGFCNRWVEWIKECME